MLVTELHRSFRFGLDKMDGFNYPNFLPEEIDLLLNQAQDTFIKQRYGFNNLKRESFVSKTAAYTCPSRGLPSQNNPLVVRAEQSHPFPHPATFSNFYYYSYNNTPHTNRFGLSLSRHVRGLCCHHH